MRASPTSVNDLAVCYSNKNKKPGETDVVDRPGAPDAPPAPSRRSLQLAPPGTLPRPGKDTRQQRKELSLNGGFPVSNVTR